MSQKKTDETKAIAIRHLTVEDKGRIREMLRYGDTARIAARVNVSYQQVLNVLSPNHPTNNDEVWIKAIEYLNGLPAVEVDARLADAIKNGGTDEEDE